MPLYRVEVSSIVYVNASNEDLAALCAVENRSEHDNQFWETEVEAVKDVKQIKADGWLGCIPYQASTSVSRLRTAEEVLDGEE